MSEQSGKVQIMPEGSKRTTNQPARILVIDDDPDIRAVVSDILSQEGYKITAVATGKEAMEACHKSSFDIGLVDIKLPDTDGTALLQMLKKICPTMIKIVVTGYPSLENAVQALNLGAEGYIIKPFKPAKLLEQIREQLEKHQLDKWESLLMNIGLSAYEAKIYLSLALNGCSEARKLSLSSGVPRTKAYTALKKLVQRGIVVEVPGGKQKFEVSAPSDAFSNFVQNWKRELSEQEKNLLDFETALSTLDQIHLNEQSLQSANMQKQNVWVVKGEDQIARRIGELISTARTSVCVTINESGLTRFYRNFHKTLDDLSDRGIKVQIRVPIGLNNYSFVGELKYAYSVRNSSILIPLLLLVVDNRDILLANLNTDPVSNASTNEICLFAQSESIAALFNELLSTYKKSSQERDISKALRPNDEKSHQLQLFEEKI